MFGDKLRLLRKNNNLTQSELAEKLEVSQGHISALEKNEKKPGSEILISLRRYFEVDLNWLLTGEKELVSNKKKIQARKFGILEQAEEWLTEIVEKNPKREIWFEVEFEKAFQEFKEWKEEKEENETGKDYTSNRKVA